MHNALWQRAVREHQRLRGTDRRAADDAVTVAVNHLGFLQEKAPWFTADPRLRAAAIDETLRHAMLGDAVRERARAGCLGALLVHPRRPARRPDREAADPLAGDVGPRGAHRRLPASLGRLGRDRLSTGQIRRGLADGGGRMPTRPSNSGVRAEEM